ncbi:adenine nucleotide alpha hydrolases-like protein [Saccharata proteae CBS 121410]|uniref:Adenine nucleotide alpha hydrolases-like protein n=1 Tax=Saccharata proteae CBS 121410 TaxID=1314787 RepID=A0A6A5YCE4_9PEZI|nr:adenine nucleotide alpha hydrolases-like protein [Saccharata proteae CBS 121410]
MSLESAMDEERRAVMDILNGIKSGRESRGNSPGGAKSPPGSTRTPAVRSMLDIDSPATAGSKSRERTSPEDAYSFDMMPSIDSQALPKRVSQGGKKAKDVKESKSPSARLAARSQSPGGKKLMNNSMNLMSDPRKYVTDSGKSIDLNSAYRRLSDANLVRSGGSLAALGNRKNNAESPGGMTRLEKDYFADEDDEDDAVRSSDDEDDYETEPESGAENAEEGSRGRRRRRRSSAAASNEEDEDGAPLPKSLLAAAEADRKRHSKDYKVRSLLDPTVTVTGPDGEKLMGKKKGVHPTTSFDQGGVSGLSTPMTSDTEDNISEIKRAQRMAMSMSPVTSTPEAHRCVRQIIRGDYAGMQKEAEQGLRRQRMYLVATDLSSEAEYALEWTIGTVLRDGDTLLAVYAVDEETGTGNGEGEGVGIGEAAAMMTDTAQLVRTLSNDQRLVDDGRPKAKGSQGPSPLGKVVEQTDDQPDFANMPKAERERWHATMAVSERCVRLLRKTKLQCRVVVEVFHCKSPKHMITEVIDFLDPTLVVLGSRGRSSLKGVLLGSFSNYLVTKSSVPVMVARKRLRKHSKYKRNNMRLSNILTSPTSGNAKLASAKID